MWDIFELTKSINKLEGLMDETTRAPNPRLMWEEVEEVLENKNKILILLQ